MTVSTVMFPEPVTRLEGESVITLQSTVDFVSGQFSEPIKPIPLIDVAEISEDDSSSSASESEDVVAATLPLTKKLSNPLALDQIVSSVVEPTSGAKKLRKMLLETEELIVCPGVYDGLSARTAIELGFNAMYMVGSHLLLLYIHIVHSI